MATLSPIIRQQVKASPADFEWLNLLLADWQIIADLLFSDLVLWLPTEDGSFIAAGHARASSAVTIFYRDIDGEKVRNPWAKQVSKAYETCKIVADTAATDFEGNSIRTTAIPVRRRVSTKSEEVVEKPIAVITRHANLSEVKHPNKIQLNYLASGSELLEMIVQGAFPSFANPSANRRGSPRVTDGLLRLDEDGVVDFASPNALSAFHRLGVKGDLEGESLAKATTPALAKSSSVDEGLALVLTGRAPWRVDLESRQITLSARAIPIRHDGKRTGALVLVRDVTDFRKQERELITKDATIREIHHRVKNNLQTVASLLRIQARRSESTEAKASLEQAMRRVSAIALVHDTLSEGLSQDVNFDEIFDRVMMLASEVAATHGTNVKTDRKSVV